jgi:hypothetical protein
MEDQKHMNKEIYAKKFVLTDLKTREAEAKTE